MPEQNIKEMLLINLVGAVVSVAIVYFAARAGAKSVCAPARGNKIRRR
jgi:hypothetical protein